VARVGGVYGEGRETGDVARLPGWQDYAVTSAAPSADDRLWRKIDALIDRAPSVGALLSHRLEVPAARRLRAAGRDVPSEFYARERLAGLIALSAPVVLESICRACDAPAIVIKGPEVAARYPDPSLRLYRDLDLLVRKPEVAHRALSAAGFEPVGDPGLFVDIHHLRPLLARGTLLPVELHSRPKWLRDARPPDIDELFEVAVPASMGVPGLLALPAEHHALLLAVHSWAHEPLRTLRDIIDIAIVAEDADRSEIWRLACAWRVERVWRTTISAVDAIFDGGRVPWSLRIWAQNLRATRERTVLEHHLERWLSNFWAMPSSAAFGRMPRRLLDEIRPSPDETWRAKATRTRTALRNAPRPRSDHQRSLDERGRRPAKAPADASD
jgi:hypothetical protein